VKTPSLDLKVRDFLAQKRIAVAGVSRDDSGHSAANVILSVGPQTHRRTALVIARAGSLDMRFGARRDAMVDVMKDRQESEARAAATRRSRLIAWILILIVNAGLVAWGAMAAALPDYLRGPGGRPILAAGYEGFSGGSWSELARTSPMTARYIEVLFRTYGAYCAAFGLTAVAVTITAFRRGEGWAWWALLVGNTITLVSAMTYDWTVNAIGPFELTEYLGLALVWGALAVTAPFRAAGGLDRRAA